MSNDVVGKKRFATLSLCVVLALVFFTVGWWIGAMSLIMDTLVIGVLALTVVVVLRLGVWVALLVLAAHLYLDWYLGNAIAGITLDWLFLGVILLSLFIRASSANEAPGMVTSSMARSVHDEVHAALGRDDRGNHRDHGLSDEDGCKECAIEDAVTEKMPETPKPRQFLPPMWLAPLTPNGRRLLKSPFPFGDR